MVRTDEDTEKLQGFFDTNCEKVVAVLFTARWFADELQSTKIMSERCTLGEIRDELEMFANSESDFAWIEVDVDSENMYSVMNTWGIQSVPRIQFFKEPCFQQDQKPSNKVPKKIDGSTRCPPWDENEDSYDLVGTLRSVLVELRSYLSDLTGWKDFESPSKKARIATRETPESLTKMTWDKLKVEYSAALKKANGEIGEGIEPSSLLNDGVLLYHHRAGSNPFLSENYPVTFWYTIQGHEGKWKSVQQAYQAAKFRDQKVIKWIEEADTAAEAIKIAKEYDTEAYQLPDFTSVNVSMMFDIVLAKFSQNPMLAKWLIDTDENGDKPAIFHTEDNAFWGLGALDPKPGSRYKGKNINGQVLMCVREVLKEKFSGQAFFPQLSFRSFDEAQNDLHSMQASFRHLGLGTGNADALPLPDGTRIDRRFRVVDYRSTAGLGSFAGQFSYICADEMPVAPSLEKRISTLLGRSICSDLRDALLKLQVALCEASDADAASKMTEWTQVFDKMMTLKKALYQDRNPNDDWLELHSRLRSWQPAAKQSNMSHRQYVDSIAFKIESLLVHKNETDHPQSVFVKTFALKAHQTAAIRHEITVCSSKQPQLFHENICGISLAGFAAPVEILRPGFGWIGLCARMPFVALENCDGCDLFDFYNCRVYAIAAALMRRMKGMGFDVGGGDTSRVNLLLQAALDFQDALFDSMRKVERALEVTDKNDLVENLCSFVDQYLSNALNPPKDKPPDSMSQPATGGPVVPSLSWTEFKGMFQSLSETNQHFRRFGSWQLLKDFLNKVIDAAARKGGWDTLNDLVNDKKFNFPKDEKEVIASSVRKLKLESLQGLASLSKDDVKRWRPVLHAIWPHLKNLHISLTVRYILELINDWDWHAASKVLRDLKIGCFKSADEDMGLASDPVKLPDASIETLRSAATRQHDAAMRFLATLSKVLCQDALCMHPKFKSWPDELVNLLLEHILANRRERMRWMKPQKVVDECPACISRVIFLQAAKAIEKLHSHQRVHADIKLENFNLTSAGQVKLLDFGFMLELSDSYPDDLKLHVAPYTSPQFKLVAHFYSNLKNKTMPFEEFRQRIIQDGSFKSADDAAALANIQKHCAEKEGGNLGLKVIHAVMKENDMWMLGNVLEKMASQTSLTEPADQLMQVIVSKIRSYEIVTIEQLINTDWLRSSKEKDHDDLREHLLPLFIRQPSPSGPNESKDAEPLFEADIGYVNTGKGFWRVFRVGDTVCDVSLGDEIVEIDGRQAPKLQGAGAKHNKDKQGAGGSERLGTFYSKMELKIKIKDQPDANAKPKLVTLRRTKPAIQEPPKGDPDRFRDYLFGKGLDALNSKAVNDEIPRTELRKLFTRWWGSHGGALLFDQVLQNWHCRGWVEVNSKGESIRILRDRMAPPP